MDDGEVTVRWLVGSTEGHAPHYTTAFSPCFLICINRTSFLTLQIIQYSADRGSRAVYGVDPQPLFCYDCGFESRRDMDVCLLWMLCVVR
jgi:hypothetical protein